MEIIVGESAGFCYGVKRAVEGTFEALKNANGEKIFCFGELVHNKVVTNKLKEDGAVFIEDINDARDVLVIRAHGIRKSDYEYLERENIKFIFLLTLILYDTKKICNSICFIKLLCYN